MKECEHERPGSGLVCYECAPDLGMLTVWEMKTASALLAGKPDTDYGKRMAATLDAALAALRDMTVVSRGERAGHSTREWFSVQTQADKHAAILALAHLTA